MPHRNDNAKNLLITGLMLASASVMGLSSISAAAQVNCVAPRTVHVSRVQGQVFDPLGAFVPGAEVSLRSGKGALLQTTTDSMGRFQMDAAPGQYVLEVVIPAFQFSSAELVVDPDLGNLKRPDTLWVIVGLGGVSCPLVTTSKKEFQQMIRADKKRLKETTQPNATQK